MKKLVILLIFLISTACGKDDRPNPNNVIENNQNNTNNQNNVSDMGTDQSGLVCSRATEILRNDPTALSLSARGEQALVSCFDGISPAIDTGIWYGEFVLTEDGDVHIEMETLKTGADIPAPTVWALYTEDCRVDSPELSCTNDPSIDMELGPGTYFLIGIGDVEKAENRVTITQDAYECVPGPSTCTDGEVTQCDNPGNEFILACPGGLCNVDACGGNVCADAVAIALEDGAPETLRSSRRGFSHDWNAEDRDGCSLEAGVPAGPSLGVDFVVEFTNLVAGDVLALDAEMSDGNFAFYVLESCAAETCLDAFAFDQNSDNRGEHTVANDGSLFVVFETLGNNNGEFTITATKN